VALVPHGPSTKGEQPFLTGANWRLLAWQIRARAVQHLLQTTSGEPYRLCSVDRFDRNTDACLSLKSGAGENSRCCPSTSLRSVQQRTHFKKQAPTSTSLTPCVASPKPPFTFHNLPKSADTSPLARLNIAQYPPASHPADRTTTSGDTGQKRSPLAPESCTPLLATCTEALAAYLQSMSQRQVSHSLPILTCDETE
jgi:hypothetical protein